MSINRPTPSVFERLHPLAQLPPPCNDLLRISITLKCLERRLVAEQARVGEEGEGKGIRRKGDRATPLARLLKLHPAVPSSRQAPQSLEIFSMQPDRSGACSCSALAREIILANDSRVFIFAPRPRGGWEKPFGNSLCTYLERPTPPSHSRSPSAPANVGHRREAKARSSFRVILLFVCLQFSQQKTPLSVPGLAVTLIIS